MEEFPPRTGEQSVNAPADAARPAARAAEALLNLFRNMEGLVRGAVLTEEQVGKFEEKRKALFERGREVDLTDADTMDQFHVDLQDLEVRVGRLKEEKNECWRRIERIRSAMRVQWEACSETFDPSARRKVDHLLKTMEFASSPSYLQIIATELEEFLRAEAGAAHRRDTVGSPEGSADVHSQPSVPILPLRAESKEKREEVRVHVRWMIRRDMPEVMDIENTCFEIPWAEEDFYRVLKQRNCIGMVAEHDERVAGYMIYELTKTTIHVLNFAVDPRTYLRGVGSQMVAKLIGKLSLQRRSRITLEVRETNLPAQLFFRDRGFRAVSVLRDFYQDTAEDAYLMQYRCKNEQEETPYSSPTREAFHDHATDEGEQNPGAAILETDLEGSEYDEPPLESDKPWNPDELKDNHWGLWDDQDAA